MNDDLKELYRLILDYRWQPRVEKIHNGMYHIYVYRGLGGRDSVPMVLKPKDASYKTCPCCKWKPD